jgi:molecular chaperone GrpE
MRRKINVEPETGDTAAPTPEADNNAKPSLSDRLADVIKEFGDDGLTDAFASAAADSSATSEMPVEAPSSDLPEKVTALEAELEQERARAADFERKLVYLQAEFQTYRRRRDEEQAGLQKYANSELIRSFLPVLDNFERALKAAEVNKNLDALIGGVAGTHKQVLTLLEKAGVKVIEAEGKEFDPNYHEAIGAADSSDLPPNTVAEVVQRGYTLHDRVLRPALVKVAQG